MKEAQTDSGKMPMRKPTETMGEGVPGKEKSGWNNRRRINPYLKQGWVCSLGGL